MFEMTPFSKIYWHFYFGTETCVPYSVEACMDVAKSLGLQLGGCNEFQGSRGYASGCYAYNGGGICNGQAFYGTWGTQESMKQSVRPPRYRPCLLYTSDAADE